MVFQFLNAFYLLLSHHDGFCQRASIDSPSLIHTCDCSVTHFGKGASPVLDFLLQLPPVVMLMIENGCSSDDSVTNITFRIIDYYSLTKKVPVIYALMLGLTKTIHAVTLNLIRRHHKLHDMKI